MRILQIIKKARRLFTDVETKWRAWVFAVKAVSSNETPFAKKRTKTKRRRDIELTSSANAFGKTIVGIVEDGFRRRSYYSLTKAFVFFQGILERTVGAVGFDWDRRDGVKGVGIVQESNLSERNREAELFANLV